MRAVYAFLLIAVPLAMAATTLVVGYLGLRFLVAELSAPRKGPESTEP